MGGACRWGWWIVIVMVVAEEGRDACVSMRGSILFKTNHTHIHPHRHHTHIHTRYLAQKKQGRRSWRLADSSSPSSFKNVAMYLFVDMCVCVV